MMIAIVRGCVAAGLLLAAVLTGCASQPAAVGAARPSPESVLAGLRDFYRNTARPDGSFQNGIDPAYLGMADTAYSDLAAVTYAVTIHKTFGWTLPDQAKTAEFFLSRQRPTGEFFNVAGTVSPDSPEGKTYNTTQALVALRALGVKPRHDALPIFEDILKQDYKTLPAYSTSFFPLAYLCAGKPIPAKADRGIRALMVQDETGYMNNHVAATYHASHYYRLVGEATPKAEEMVARTLRDQAADGSWLINMPSRDRHATFDAVFVLHQEGNGRTDCAAAIQRAADWALACRNDDGGFGHYPGSTSDADAIYFHVGTLVMAGFLKPADPLPRDPHLLSWGHLMPLRKPGDLPESWSADVAAWARALTFSPDSKTLAVGAYRGSSVLLFDASSGRASGRINSLSHTVDLCFSADGTQLVTGGYFGDAQVWDLKQLRRAPRADRADAPRRRVEHGCPVVSVAFAPDGSQLTGGFDGVIKRWPKATGEPYMVEAPLATLTGHRSWVNSLAITRDGTLLSGSSDGTVKLWSLTTNTCLKSIDATNAEVRGVACSADGKWIAAGMRYGVIKVWDAATFEERYAMKAPEGDAWSVTFTPDSQTLVTGSGDWNRGGHVKFWSMADGQETRQFQHTGEVLCVAVSPDGTLLAVGGGDKSIRVWRVK